MENLCLPLNPRAKRYVWLSLKNTWCRIASPSQCCPVRPGTGTILFNGVAGLAIGTGALVLFVDMPLFLLTVLSVISLAALVLAVASARVRFFHSATPAVQDTTPPVPEKKFPEPLFPEPVIEPVIPDETEPHDTKKPEHGLLTRYNVTPPYSSVKIVRLGNAGFTYTIIEPSLSAREKTILRETYTYLRDVIIYDDTENNVDKHLNTAVIYPVFRQFDPTLSDERLAILYYYLKRDLSGYGPLDVLMRDPALEDMSCNGKDLPVFIFHRVYGSLPTSVVFSEGELNQFVLKLAQKANKQISLSNPMVDATLPDGARIQITYSNVVSPKGSSFTIRKVPGRADDTARPDPVRDLRFRDPCIPLAGHRAPQKPDHRGRYGKRQDLDHERGLALHPAEREDRIP